MKSLVNIRLLLAALVALVAGCAADTSKPPTSILGEAPRSQAQSPMIDSDLNGLWMIVSAEMAGKPMQLPPDFELKITDDRYGSGIPSGYSDRGRIVLFGDELAGQARRMDVVSEVGVNKGKRFPALYRMVGRNLEVVYDMSGMNRPTEFVSREGTQLFRVTYRKKQ
jgi:uncharacterized protein (TIGR03067 family)